jgi:hypothetical protein
MPTPRYALPIFLMVVLVGAGALAWKLLDDVSSARAASIRKGEAHSKPEAAHDQGAANPVDAVRTADDAASRIAAAPAPASSRDAPPLFPAERRHADWNALVEDDDGHGIADVDVQVDPSLGGFAQGLEIADDRGVSWNLRSGADGRVRVSSLAAGAYSLKARAPDGRTARTRFAFRADPSDTPLTIQLNGYQPRPTGVEVAVVGLDDAPVADALVELFGSAHGLGAVDDGVTSSCSTKSDVRGRARFVDLDWYRGLAFARAPDGRVGSITVDERSAGPEAELSVAATIVVQPAARIVGRLVDGSGAEKSAIERALAGATVDAYVATSQSPWNWTFGRSYTAPVVARAFTFDALPAGTCSFVLHAPGGARLLLKRYDFGGKLENSVTPSLAVVKSGATAEVALTIALGAMIAGRVHRADGSPIANATVTAVFAPRTSNFPDGFVLHGVNVWRFDSDTEVASDHPLTHVHTRTDATGSYTLDGLQAGQQRVMVTASGLCFDRREGVVVADGQTTTLDHVLEPAGALQGIAPEDGYLGITRGGDAQPTAIAILGRDQTFTFAALRPGDYAIAQFHSDASIDPVVFAHATVVAGRTTFVDLTDAPGPVEIAGQVVDANGPVVAAEVEFFPSRVHVDGGGRFTFHRCFPLYGNFTLRVTSRRILWDFKCDPAPFANVGWRGVLRLGEETLRVECRDPRGAPVAGTVSIVTDGEVKDVIRSHSLPLDGLGAATIERLAPGRYTVELRVRHGAVVNVKVELPRKEILSIVAPDCGTLEVTLLDADGRPIPSWNVVAGSYLRDGEIPADVEGHDEWFEWRWASTDRSGRAKLLGVRTGRILLKAPNSPRDVFLGKQLTPPPVQHLDLRADETKTVELRSPARRDGAH